MEIRTYRLHLVVKPSTDVKGAWTAHCLDLDVVTWAYSPDEGLRLLLEAVRLVAVDDVSKGRDPYQTRPKASSEEFAEYLAYDAVATPWEAGEALDDAQVVVGVIELRIGVQAQAEPKILQLFYTTDEQCRPASAM